VTSGRPGSVAHRCPKPADARSSVWSRRARSPRSRKGLSPRPTRESGATHSATADGGEGRMSWSKAGRQLPPRPCNHSTGPRRRREAPEKKALLASPRPGGVRAGLRASRRPARIASQVAPRRPKTTRGPWRRPAAPEHAQFSRARFGRPDSGRSTVVADDRPWLSAEAAGASQPLEASGPARRTGSDTRLCDRRKVEPVGDTFVAKRRPVHPADQSCHSLRYGGPLCHECCDSQANRQTEAPAKLAVCGRPSVGKRFLDMMRPAGWCSHVSGL